MWCIAEITPEYRRRMYRLLDLYRMPYDPHHPVVCVDEKSKQLLANSRDSLAAKPGSPEKFDYEYKRNGTCNLFVAMVPKAGRRIVKVTDKRTKADFAKFVEQLVSIHFRTAAYIQLVVDNLNTHFKSSFYETMSKRKADRLLKRVRFIYTPKHASWLNMAEIEINVMDRQCTGVRIASKEQLASEVQQWSKKRNRDKSDIEWKFTRQDADKKLAKHYVS